MIDKKILTMKLRDFAINYDIKIKEQYIDFIERQLNEEGFTNEDFIESIDMITKTTTTTFNKMPNLAMFLENSDKKVIPVEQQAQQEAVKVIDFAQGYSYSRQVLFDNKTTNAVINEVYGGVGSIIWAFDSSNNNKAVLTWWKREFIENWINYFQLKKEKSTPLIRSSITDDDGIIQFVGDRGVCLKMLKENTNLIENRNDNVLKIDSVIKNLGNNLKAKNG